MKTILSILIVAYFLSGCDRSSDNPDILENVSYHGQNAMAPNLFADEQENTYLTWIEKKETGHSLKFSVLRNGHWEAPEEIISGEDWFVNWADYPALATINGRELIAHHLKKSGAGTYSYDVKINVSNDGGKSWEVKGKLHGDSTEAEHGFVSLVPYGANFFAAWLDGREMPDSGAMTLRAAHVDPTGKKLEKWVLDDQVCECCQTASVITPDGPLVAYRNRTANEIRDIYTVKYERGKWSEPKTVVDEQWEINGCPVNGPAMAAFENSVVLAYFTAASGTPAVKLVWSSDGGRTFSSPVTLHQATPVGRVDVDFINEEKAFVSWMEGGIIMGAEVTNKGKVVNRYALGKSSESRSSGFPQVIVVKNDILLAYTDLTSGSILTGLLRRTE